MLLEEIFGGVADSNLYDEVPLINRLVQVVDRRRHSE